jgi:hypothetical protein
MIFVCPDFQKHYFIAFADFQTDLLELLVNRGCEHRPSIFCWTHNVVHQD